MFRKTLSALVLVLFLAGWMVEPLRAQTATPDCTGVVIQPQSIYSSVSPTEIVISGSGASVAQVVMSTVGVLNLTSGGSGILIATIPAGVPAGIYSLTFLDASGNTLASCTNVLTILDAPASTSTPAPTSTSVPTNFARPVIAIDIYGASSPAIVPGQDLDFDLTLVNWGQLQASNIVLIFTAGDFAPRVTGGQRVVNFLDPQQRIKVYQPLTASNSLGSKNVATLEVKVSYTDAAGNPYNETFTLTFPIFRPGTGAKPTATATLAPRPQLLIQGYQIDAESLQPGQRFGLALEVVNVGATTAKRVTMILGGGTASGSSGRGNTGDGSSTQGAPGSGGSGGGVSAGGSDLANFAPIESSNVQFVGDVAGGALVKLTQKLIVNATTDAGAYPVKFSFAYTDEAGNNFNDDQVITLLVYAPPLLEISFYRPPDPFFVGQPGQLPIQVVNQSRTGVLLGNMRVTAPPGVVELSNNTILVGTLDAGGTFPLDAVAIPAQPGPFEVTVTVDYVDDFNQPQTFTQTLAVEVMESPIEAPGGPKGPGGFDSPPPEPESLWQKIVRFIAGLLGFNSAPSSGGEGSDLPPPGQEIIITPAPGPKGFSSDLSLG